jgi:phage shock protein C
MKKLYRSRKNKAVSGIFGGLGEMYDVDPTILRLAFVFLALATAVFPALIFYIIAAMIIPLAPKTRKA